MFKLFLLLVYCSLGVFAQIDICPGDRSITCVGHNSAVVATQKLLFIHELSTSNRSTHTSYGNTFYFQQCSSPYEQAMNLTANTYADPNDPNCAGLACGDIILGYTLSFPSRDYGNGTSYSVKMRCVFTSNFTYETTNGSGDGSGDGGDGDGSGNSQRESSSASIISFVF